MTIAQLKSHAARMDELSDELAQRIAEARDYGLSWELIGWSLGMAGEAARQRWGPRRTPRGRRHRTVAA